MKYDHFIISPETLMPAAVVAGGVIIGIVLEGIILGKLRRVSKGEDGTHQIAAEALRYMIMLSISILTIYGTIHLISMNKVIFFLLKKILNVLMVFTGTIICSRFVAGFMSMYIKKTGGAVSAFSIFVNTVKLLVYSMGFMIALDSIGVAITPILTAMGVGGLAVALGLQSTLANLFSGLHVIASGKIRVGDYVKLSSGEEGYIDDMTWRDTTIKTPVNNVVVIPNSKLAAASVTNYSFPSSEMTLTFQVGVGYESDLEKVGKVTVDVMKELMRDLPGCMPEFEPFVQYSSFSDSGIKLSMNMLIRDFSCQAQIQHELVIRLHRRYAVEGIAVAFPMRTIFLKDSGVQSM